MINIVSKIDWSKIGWEGGGSTSIWIMSLNIMFFLFLFFRVPLITSNHHPVLVLPALLGTSDQG